MANKLALRPGIKLNKFTPPTHAHMYSRMVQTRYVYVLKCDVKTSMLHFYNEKLSFNFQERWGGGNPDVSVMSSYS